MLTGMHVPFARWVADFAVDRNARGHPFYRMINEVPTILMIGIVVLATLKRF